ncbi:hypothetical protein WDU94_015590 [Cyamophila willieti]
MASRLGVCTCMARGRIFSIRSRCLHTVNVKNQRVIEAGTKMSTKILIFQFFPSLNGGKFSYDKFLILHLKKCAIKSTFKKCSDQ